MESNLNTLRNHLAAFDGRALTILGEIEARFKDHNDYLNNLVALSSDPDIAVSSGSTWLIKSCLEIGGELSDMQTKALVSQIEKIGNWAAQLHLCQSVRYLNVGSEEAEKLVCWLLPLLSHDRPFLRAWSLDAICHVSKQHPGFAGKAQQAHREAFDDPAASVRARARNIRLH